MVIMAQSAANIWPIDIGLLASLWPVDMSLAY